jgi:outer membrane protein TolC
MRPWIILALWRRAISPATGKPVRDCPAVARLHRGLPGVIRLRRCLIAALLLPPMHMARADAGRTLTLEAAVEQALAHNPVQVSQRLDTGKSDTQRQAARGARWPAVDFSASATRYAYPTLVYPIRAIGVFPPLDDTLYNYGVALKLPLYTGGRLQQGMVLADLGKEISLERERLGAQGLIYNVSSVYLKILQLSALVQVYDARIVSLEAQEHRLALLVRVGRAARLDHLKVNGLLTKARYDRLQIDNRRSEAWTLLYQLMGGKRPAEPVALQAYAPAPAPDSSLDDLWRDAQAQNPELKIAEQQTAAGTAREKMARAERLPSLSLVGGYREYAGSDRQFVDDWNMGVQLALPLLDGGVRRAHIEEAALTSAQAQQALEETRLELNKQLQDAWNGQTEAASRLTVTGTSVAEASEAQAIEKLKYEQGVGVITDLLATESALLTAQADRLQARFDLIMARFNLLRATGTLSRERAATLVHPVSGDTEENNKP